MSEMSDKAGDGACISQRDHSEPKTATGVQNSRTSRSNFLQTAMSFRRSAPVPTRARSSGGSQEDEAEIDVTSQFERDQLKMLVSKYSAFDERQVVGLIHSFCDLQRKDGQGRRPTLTEEQTMHADLLHVLADMCYQHLQVDIHRLDAEIKNLKNPSDLSFSEVVDIMHKSRTGGGRHRSDSSAKCVGISLPIDPDSVGKQIWDLMVMVLLLYTSFSVPFAISFNQNPVSLKEQVTVYGVFDLAIDCIFCTDMALCFLTAYTERGIFVVSLHTHAHARTHAYEHTLTQHLHAKVSYGRIAVHYLKTWFFLDFFGSVPFDKIGEFILDTGEDAESQLKPLRMIR